MGRKPSPNGYSVSRYNRMTNAVMIHGILPSRGVERCPLSNGCPCQDHDDIRHLCIPGEPCPAEEWFLRQYTASARRTHTRCLGWLSGEVRDIIIHELGILSLRRQRLSVMTAREGFTRPKIHPVSGVEYGLKETVGLSRYATAIDNLFRPLFDQLLYSPTERAERDREEAEGRPLILPFTLPEQPAQPARCESHSPPISNPTVAWPAPHRPWQHEPGRPNADGPGGATPKRDVTPSP